MANTTLSPPRCQDFPCFVAYSKDTDLLLDQPSYTPTLFALWCEQVLNPHSYHLPYPEQVRQVLNSEETVLFGIDIDRPSEIPNGVRFFLVPGSAMAEFAENLTAGLYLYRPKDRTLRLFQGNLTRESTTLLFGPEDNYTAKDFIAGYAMGLNHSASALEIELLNEIADKFVDNVSFVVMPEEEGKKLLSKGRLDHMRLPFLFVFRSANISGGRWFLRGEEAHDRERVVSFLSSIVEGTENYSIQYSTFSEEDPDDRVLKEVNALNIEQAILTNNSVTLLLVTATWCEHCKTFKPHFRRAAEILIDQNVKFYWVDGPENDLPDFIPEHEGFPALWLWPAGENYTQPIGYKGVPDLEPFLTWIGTNCQLNIELSQNGD